MPRTINVPYEGEPPPVKPGDLVWCRPAWGPWRQRIALSAPRYDRVNAAGGRCYLTVRTREPDDPDDLGYNWPADDVRLTPPEQGEVDIP